jgi:hypothetical protein
MNSSAALTKLFSLGMTCGGILKGFLIAALLHNSSFSQNLLINGSFETPRVASATYGNLILPGWQSTEGTLEVWADGYLPGSHPVDGRQSIEVLGSHNAVTISQTVPTDPGTDYALRFSHSPRPGVRSTLRVLLDSKTIAAFDEDGRALTGFNWQTFRTNFTALTNLTTLSFFDTASTAAGTQIDGIVIEKLGQPIANGDFESPGLPGREDFRYLTNGDTFVTGWTVINDGLGEPLYYVKRTNSVYEGQYAIALNQGSGMQTILATDLGSLYEVSFWIRSQPLGCASCFPPSPLRVTVADVVTNFPVIEGWSYRTVQFIATNATPRLEIFNPSPAGDFRGYVLDDVNVVKLTAPVLDELLYPGIVLTGQVGATFQIQITDNLSNSPWEPLTNVLLPSSPFLFLDIDPTRPFDYPPKRMYRAVQLP